VPQTSELALPTPTPERYTNEADLTESLGRKGTANPGDGLYPRDGEQGVTEIEAALSLLTMYGQESNVVVSAGMAAVSGAARYSLQLKGREGVKNPTLAHPPQLYTQSINSFEALKLMGVETTFFDPGDTSSVDRLFDEKKADVIFAETVSNIPDIPVLDVDHLLARTREAGEEAPILVLDNTLPLSTGVDFSRILTGADRVLLVESATKGAMHNSEHLGVVYSPHRALINGFRRFKVTEGLVTSVNASADILETLETTAPGFHERNKALYESTAILGTWLDAARRAQGDNTEFMVEFPTLDDHPNHAYASEHLVNGVAPVAFLSCTKFEEDVARRFLKRISEHPAMVEQIDEGQVYLGQSFGFKEATLLYDPDATQVRVAGGYDIDSQALGKALFKAVLDFGESPF